MTERPKKYGSKQGSDLELKAVMDLKNPNREKLELSKVTSRVINPGEGHEILVLNNSQDDETSNVAYLGFFYFNQGMVLEVGDPLIDDQGQIIGAVLGFDYTHLTGDGTLNHMNIVLKSSNDQSGFERGFQAGQKFKFPSYGTEEIQRDTRITVAQALFKIFNELNIKDIFGYPGETSFSYYAALAEYQGKHHAAADETIAAHMADAYARTSNTIGVVDVPKVGAPLATLPLLEAKNSSIPMLLVTSGSNTTKESKHPTCEYDQLAMLKPVTKDQLKLTDPDKLVLIIRQALQKALSGNPGPIALEIPSNILGVKIDDIDLSQIGRGIKCPMERPVANEASIDKVLELLKTAKRPVILAGGGLHQSQAYEALANFAKKLNIPVATTINGKGAFDETESLSVGVIGSKGDQYSNAFINDADVIFVIGSKLGDKSTNQYKILAGKRVIHLDINPEEMDFVVQSDAHLVGDAQATLLKISEIFDTEEKTEDKFKFEDRTTQLSESRIKRAKMYEEFEGLDMQVAPSLLCKLLDMRFNSDLIVVADGSTASGWSSVLIKSKGGARANIQPRGTGMIGYGLPATLGAVIANGKKPIIGIGGDGGLKPTMHTLETAVRDGQDLTYFVLDDSRLTFMEKILEEAYGYNPIPKTPNSTDLELIARGFGAKSITLNTNQELQDYIKNHNWKSVNLVVLKINPEMQSPDLIMSLEKNKKKKG
jgi:acetolactate synthase-1/2/3 large subunit